LVDQASLHLNQPILIPGQGFQFGNQRARLSPIGADPRTPSGHTRLRKYASI
jgi:hypothetical protein